MWITLTTPNGQTEQIELGEDLQINEVKGFVEALFGVPLEEQVLMFNQRALPSSGTLASHGVRDRDLIMVVKRTAAPQPTSASPPRPIGGKVFWEGMTMDDVFENNQNPEHIVDIFQGNEMLLKELNYHHPKLSQALRKERATALSELRKFLITNATTMVLNRMERERVENEMKAKLAADPNSKEAKDYFEGKNKQRQVEESYTTMMRDYPEALSRVLMLYIDVEINGVHLQAFVDSGAQTSVISARCAEKCGISNLIDSRFAGKVVGVGTGSTLGRVHVVPLNINNNFFPMSLTVMDDSKGLGDTNMEFLLGLDMLKRHRCSIDLADGKLYFHGAAGRVSTSFLHEKDLPEAKGGTKGYDPNLALEDATMGNNGGASESAQAPSSNSAVDEETVTTLMALGYTRDKVVAALGQANGDAELAKTLLVFGGQ